METLFVGVFITVIGGLILRYIFGVGKNIDAIRLKHSSNQAIQFSSAPGEYNENLNLGNITLMKLGDQADSSSVEMLLPESTPRTVENPKTDTEYKISGGYSLKFPSVLGTIVKSFTDIPLGSKILTFNRFNQKTQIIEAGGKKFIVTLQDIIDKSRERHKLIEYTFSVT